MMIQHVAIRNLADRGDPIEKPARNFRSALSKMIASACGAHYPSLPLTLDGEIQDRSEVGNFSLTWSAKEGRQGREFLQPIGLEPKWTQMKKERDCHPRGPIQHYRRLIGSIVGQRERQKSADQSRYRGSDLLLVGAEEH